MIIKQLSTVPLVPVLRNVPYAKSSCIIKALVEGGARSIEVTMETDLAEKMIEETAEAYRNRILVGAGTVLTVDECERAIKAGAQFIVTPVLDEEVVRFAMKKEVPVIPGVFTPSEMLRAVNLGAPMIKLFPASVLGSAFIRDVKGPLSHIPIMTTGGITLDTARDFLDAGAIAVGVGSALLRKDLIDSEDWTQLTKETRRWLEKLNISRSTI
ncbi:bifunctional 4-hydroxy-2-oxoglutarate aldolase/2-dehydro-3-deoxy-phosphogluconate aldolase [Aeribacillus sp. FSL K6-8394]|uniref:bifunctional 4-hydroxy-2-oxoglutarate aldolase/2-dehydro-3-deoxy-phosphogluconate aldolase n=1 Tax=Aeribacillus sp. FSL K6-8394 TaxID=2954570 RepID=UPI0030F9A1EE